MELLIPHRDIAPFEEIRLVIGDPGAMVICQRTAAFLAQCHDRPSQNYSRAM